MIFIPSTWLESTCLIDDLNSAIMHQGIWCGLVNSFSFNMQWKMVSFMVYAFFQKCSSFSLLKRLASRFLCQWLGQLWAINPLFINVHYLIWLKRLPGTSWRGWDPSSSRAHQWDLIYPITLFPSNEHIINEICFWIVPL